MHEEQESSIHLLNTMLPLQLVSTIKSIPDNNGYCNHITEYSEHFTATSMEQLKEIVAWTQPQRVVSIMILLVARIVMISYRKIL